MDETILTADGTSVVEIPRRDWEAELRGAPESIRKRLAFMTPEHHAVRRFVVSALPRQGAITIDQIAAALTLPRSRVVTIVGELEKGLFFLVRDDRNAVSWAFPVTSDETPHALAFSSGERCFAA